MAYRNDIIIPGTLAENREYYLFPGTNFNTIHGLNPGDVVGIKQGPGGENFIKNIDLGAGIVNGITFIPDPDNTVPITIGWFGCGVKGQNIKVKGKNNQLLKGLKFNDPGHFGLSWGCVGDLEVADVLFDGCMMGMQLVTEMAYSGQYPLSYQNIWIHDVLCQNTSDEAFYLGYVNTSPIRMNVNMERVKAYNIGRDAFQLRNCNVVTLTDCEGDLIGTEGNTSHNHGFIFGGNSNGATLKRVKITRCTGAGFFNIGFGTVSAECCEFHGTYGALIKITFGDELGLGHQTTVIKNSTIEGPIICYDENAAVTGSLTVDASKLISAPVSNFTRITYSAINGTGPSKVVVCDEAPPPIDPPPIDPPPVDPPPIPTGANNIFAISPQVVVAKINMTFEQAGFTADKVVAVYSVGNPNKSYVPGREINSLTSMEAGKSYYVEPKIDMNKMALFMPPIPTGSLLTTTKLKQLTNKIMNSK